MRITSDTLSSEYISKEKIDIYTIFTVKNISSYSFCQNTFDNWNVDTFVPDIESDTTYLIIDLAFNEAFMHWVFESAIYLQLYKLLKKRIPGIKLLLKTKRVYKMLFCDFFDINDSDIVYEIDLSKSNTCIFPSPISALNDKSLSDEYKEQLTFFWNYFSKYRSHSSYKKIKTLIMPRQSKENFWGNPRTYSFNALINFFNKKDTSEYHILNTDNITSLKEQLEYVSNSDNIILSDGSALYVNSMFAYNSYIMIVDTISISQVDNYAKMNIIKKYGTDINKNTHVHFNNENDIISALQL